MSKAARHARARKLDALDLISVIGVARQSRGDDGSMSTDDQREALRVACERNGWHLTDVYVEQDVSGQRPLSRRPGLKRAVEDVERGDVQMLLVAYFDRLVRSLKTQTEVMERIEAVDGASLRALDAGEISNATAVGWMSATQLGMIAEFYARQTGEKTAVSKQRNIDNGIPPFPRITPAYERIDSGKQKGRLRVHKTNGPLIREACQMRARGESYTTITRWLNEQGLAITQTGVQTTFASRLLIGEIHFGSFTPNLNAIDKPLISRALFARMHKARAPRGRRAKSERLLARLGVLVCGTCGARMTAHSTKSKSSDKRYTYYGCANRITCKRPAVISAPYVEDFVRDEAIKLSQSYKGRASHAVDLEAARLAVVDVDERLTATIETLALTKATKHESARRVLAELQAEHEAAVAFHDRLLAVSTPTLTVTTRRDWDKFSLEGKRGVIHATIARAVVAPGERTGPRVADGRVTIETRSALTE